MRLLGGTMTAGLALATSLALAACGSGPSGSAAPAPDDPPSRTPTGLPTPTPVESPAPPEPPRPSPARCGSTDLLLVATGPIEPALGHRYLPLAVENCTDGPVRLDELPALSAEDADGRQVGVRARPRPGVPVVPRTLAPGERAHLGLEWVPRGAGSSDVATLVLRLPSTGSEHRLVDEVGLDLDGRDRIEVYPWAGTPQEVFQLTR